MKKIRKYIIIAIISILSLLSISIGAYLIYNKIQSDELQNKKNNLISIVTNSNNFTNDNKHSLIREIKNYNTKEEIDKKNVKKIIRYKNNSIDILKKFNTINDFEKQREKIVNSKSLSSILSIILDDVHESILNKVKMNSDEIILYKIPKVYIRNKFKPYNETICYNPDKIEFEDGIIKKLYDDGSLWDSRYGLNTDCVNNLSNTLETEFDNNKKTENWNNIGSIKYYLSSKDSNVDVEVNNQVRLIYFLRKKIETFYENKYYSSNNDSLNLITSSDNCFQKCTTYIDPDSESIYNFNPDYDYDFKNSLSGYDWNKVDKSWFGDVRKIHKSGIRGYSPNSKGKIKKQTKSSNVYYH